MMVVGPIVLELMKEKHVGDFTAIERFYGDSINVCFVVEME